MNTFFHNHLNYKLTVLRQSHVLSPLICLVLSYFLYLEDPAQWRNCLVLLGSAAIYIVVLLVSYRPVDKQPLYLASCWLTLFLMGYFLSVYPLADSPALPWLCILPSLLIFFLDGKALLVSSVVVIGYLAVLIYPALFMPHTQMLVSEPHSLMLMVSSTCALGFAFFISFALWNINNKQKKDLFEQNEKDPLTGAFNRRALQQRIERRSPRKTTKGQGLGVVMVDVDNFKRINDTFGHAVGDSVLKMVTASIRQNLRADDLLARYGGEEFVLLFEQISQRELLSISQRILHSVRSNDLHHRGERISVTVSGGCVYQHASQHGSIEEVLQLADEKLYEAKHQGKDRIVHLAM